MSRYSIAPLSAKEIVDAAGVVATIVNDEVVVSGITQDSR